MAGKSGTYACARAGDAVISEVTSWSYEESIQDVTYSSCATDGWISRVEGGNKDITATIEGVFDPDNPVQDELALGTIYEMDFYSDTTGPVYDTMHMKVLTRSRAANVEDGEVQRWTVTLGLVVDATHEAPTFNNTTGSSF